VTVRADHLGKAAARRVCGLALSAAASSILKISTANIYEPLQVLAYRMLPIALSL
jgi:hypothetical protein